MDRFFPMLLAVLKGVLGEKAANRLKSWTWIPALAVAAVVFGKAQGWWTLDQDTFWQMMVSAGFVSAVGVADNATKKEAPKP